jgi:hypothetical protein
MKKLLMIMAVLLSGCAGVGSSTEVGNEVSDTKFYQHWVHSYEEQGDKKTPNIFRPKGSREFPASRFRMEFGFDPNGQCNYKFLSPTDAHEMRNCVFTKVGNKVYLYDEQGKLLKHLLFTLENPVTADEMRMSYGIKAPAKKEAVKKK